MAEQSPYHNRLIGAYLCMDSKQVTVPLSYTDKPIHLMDLMPIAQTLCNAIVKATRELSKLTCGPVVCEQCQKPVCCQHLFAVSAIEAAYLGEKLLKDHTPEMLALVDRCRNRARRIDRMILEMENARHYSAPKGSKGALAQLCDWYNHLELERIFRMSQTQYYRISEVFYRDQ